VNVADEPPAVDEAKERHATESKQADFLPVQHRNAMRRIWYPNEGQPMLVPEGLEGRRTVRANCDDLHASFDEEGVVLTQTRQLRAAVRSQEATQEGKQEDALALQI
jgi:hypothetical protein